MIEAVLVQVGRGVVTPAIKLWVARQQRIADRSLPLAELINRQVTDAFTRRKVEREIDKLVDSVAERLQPLIATVPDNEVAAALAAVADAFGAAELSDQELFATDVDPVKLSGRLREAAPDNPDRAGLSADATRLYEIVLDECCVCFTQLVVQIQPFANRGIAELLSRTSGLADKIDDVLARLPVRPLAREGDEDGQFLNRYLGHLSDTMDELELYGVDVRRYRPRTKLSVAYISLSVSTSGMRRPAAASESWIPGLLRGFEVSDSETNAGSVRIEQALHGVGRTLIRGDAGSGKTTLLRWLAVTAARSRFGSSLEDWNGRIPFMIKLRSHAGGPLPAPQRLLDDAAAPIAALTPDGWVHRQLDSGRAMLLVDGVDELPAADRREVRRWLRELLTAYPETKVVVTSRPAAAADRWLGAEGFGTANLERMNPADLRVLARQWHEAVRAAGDLPCPERELPRYEAALLARLDANPHLQALATSPLMCAMLCALNLDRATQLPPDRIGVYRAAVDLLLQRRDAERNIPGLVPELAVRDKLQLLQHLAWRLSVNGRAEIASDEAGQRLGEKLATMRQVTAAPADVLEHLVQRSGILRTPALNRVDFVHRTFQEYLTAREAAEQGDIGLLVERAHLDSWRETIILAAGHANKPLRRELLTGILDRASGEPAHRRTLILLAAACLETVPAVEPPELLARIEVALDGLLPPRNTREIRSLAAVGEPLLRRLPTDLAELSAAQAAAIVQAVALVNGAPALDMLAGYAADPRHPVQRALANAWKYFEPREYVDRVLADAPLASGYVEITDPGLLPLVPRLRRLESVAFLLPPGTRCDVRALAGLPALTHLSAPDGLVGMDGDLSWLTEHDRLTFLNIECPGISDLAPVAEMPQLGNLHLYSLPAGLDLRCLTRLTGLTGLTLFGENMDAGLGDLAGALPKLRRLAVGAGWRCSVEVLKRFRPLEYLGLYFGPTPPNGLRDVVDALPDLRQLDLCYCPWVGDLTPLADLTQLDSLSLRQAKTGDYSPLGAVSGLRRLLLGNCERIDGLAEIARLPRLRHLELSELQTEVDLSPLAGCRLTLVMSGQFSVTGIDRLGRGVKIIDRRSRVS